MILITDLAKIRKPFTDTVLTLGNFDGVHLGHQALVRMVIDRARQASGISMVVTFRPHPLKVLAPEKCPPLISIYEEKIRLFEQLGVDVLVKIPFTMAFSSMTPRDFVKNILCELLGARQILVGSNYRFGKGREGNVASLRQFGTEFGFSVHEVEHVSINNEVISSTAIRQFIRQGDVEHAARLLGRDYAITGVVIRGDSRGKELGFPTANIAPKHSILPSDGVYAVRLLAREKYYDGIANLGLRPTFNKDTLSIEVHIFNFNEDLYGEEISVYFIRKIRDEMKFPGPKELVQQITSDIISARKILSSYPAYPENGV